MAFNFQRRYVANNIRIVQNTHYRKVLEENNNDFKQIFNVADKLLFRDEPPPFPPPNDTVRQACDFSQFLRE